MQFKTSVNHDLATGSDIVLGQMAKIPACPSGRWTKITVQPCSPCWKLLSWLLLKKYLPHGLPHAQGGTTIACTKHGTKCWSSAYNIFLTAPAASFLQNRQVFSKILFFNSASRLTGFLPVKYLKVVIWKRAGGAARTSKLYCKKVYNK